MKNIGLDFSLLNDRVSGSFDYFWNDITDMLGYANSNGISMFGSYPSTVHISAAMVGMPP